MPRYRHHLPQLDDKLFLTDGGMETTLIYLEDIDLPAFAAFPLLQDRDGREQFVPIIANTPGSPASKAWASYWRAPPGAPARTGVPCLAIRSINSSA